MYYFFPTVTNNVNAPLFKVWTEALRIIHKLCCDEQNLKKSKMEDATIEEFELLLRE